MKKKSEKNSVVKMGTSLPVFNPHAAGIDIGDTMHCVAINDGNGGHEVKTTSSFTCDLHEIVFYLKSNGVTTAAMESTGVYWLTLYILLEEAGIEPYLVNASHVKNVTGRKKMTQMLFGFKNFIHVVYCKKVFNQIMKFVC